MAIVTLHALVAIRPKSNWSSSIGSGGEVIMVGNIARRPGAAAADPVLGDDEEGATVESDKPRSLLRFQFLAIGLQTHHHSCENLRLRLACQIKDPGTIFCARIH